jgi:hypothetical protein
VFFDCLTVGVEVGAEENKKTAEAMHCFSIATASTVLVSVFLVIASSTAWILMSTLAISRRISWFMNVDSSLDVGFCKDTEFDLIDILVRELFRQLFCFNSQDEDFKRHLERVPVRLDLLPDQDKPNRRGLKAGLHP